MEFSKKSLKKIPKMIIKSFIILFYLTFVVSLLIGGIWASIITIIPDEASKPCYLGYYAHCSFTPYSTLIGIAITLIGTLLLLKLIKYFRRKYNKAIETKPFLRILIKG